MGVFEETNTEPNPVGYDILAQKDNEAKAAQNLGPTFQFGVDDEGYVTGGDSFSEYEKKRRMDEAAATAAILSSTDFSKMDDFSARALFSECSRVFTDGAVVDDDGSLFFPGRASEDPRKNLEMMLRFIRGEHRLVVTPEYEQWSKMSFDEKFAFAKSKEDKVDWNAFKSNTYGQRGTSWVDLIGRAEALDQAGQTAIFGDEGRKRYEEASESLSEGMRNFDESTMDEATLKKYKKDVVDDYERKITKRMVVAKYLSARAGLSDRAANILATGYAKGEIDADALQLLTDEDEVNTVLGAFKDMRGDRRSGRLLFVNTEFEGGNPVVDRAQMMLYGFQQSIVGLVKDPYQWAKDDIGPWLYLNFIEDKEDADRSTRFFRIRSMARRALEQPLPEAGTGILGFIASGGQGVSENLHWIIPYTGWAKGTRMASAASGLAAAEEFQKANKFGRLVRFLKPVLPGGTESAKMAREASEKLSAAQKELGEILAASGMAKKEESIARQVATIETYKNALASARSGVRSSVLADANGTLLATASEYALTSAFAKEYLDNAINSGVPWEDAVLTSVGVGFVNGMIESLYVPGMESNLSEAELSRFMGSRLVQAFHENRTREWLSSWARRYLSEGAKVAVTEGAIEEPLQQLVINFAAKMDLLRSEYGVSESVVRALQEEILSGKGIQTYFDTVVEMLPSSVGFGITSMPGQMARKSWREWRTRSTRVERLKKINDWRSDMGKMEMPADMTADEAYALTGDATLSEGADLGVADALTWIDSAKKSAADALLGRRTEADGKKDQSPGVDYETSMKAETSFVLGLEAYRQGKGEAEIADVMGVPVKVAQLCMGAFERVEAASWFNPTGAAAISQSIIAHPTEESVKRLNPTYVEGSFVDLGRGSWSYRITAGDSEKTIGIIRESPFMHHDGSLNEQALNDVCDPKSGMFKAFAASYNRSNGENAWELFVQTHDGPTSRSEALRTANGYMEKGGLLWTEDKDGMKFIEVDNLVYLTPGKLGMDDGKSPRASSQRQLPHEIFHVNWEYFKDNISLETRKKIAEHFGIDTSQDEKDWDTELQEALAPQFERYQARALPKGEASGLFDFIGGMAAKALEAVGVGDTNIVNPKTGKAYELADLYEAFLDGRIGTGWNAVEKLHASTSTGGDEAKTEGAKGSESAIPVETSNGSKSEGRVDEDLHEQGRKEARAQIMDVEGGKFDENGNQVPGEWNRRKVPLKINDPQVDEELNRIIDAPTQEAFERRLSQFPFGQLALEYIRKERARRRATKNGSVQVGASNEVLGKSMVPDDIAREYEAGRAATAENPADPNNQYARFYSQRSDDAGAATLTTRLDAVDAKDVVCSHDDTVGELKEKSEHQYSSVSGPAAVDGVEMPNGRIPPGGGQDRTANESREESVRKIAANPILESLVQVGVVANHGAPIAINVDGLSYTIGGNTRAAGVKLFYVHHTGKDGKLDKEGSTLRDYVVAQMAKHGVDASGIEFPIPILTVVKSTPIEFNELVRSLNVSSTGQKDEADKTAGDAKWVAENIDFVSGLKFHSNGEIDEDGSQESIRRFENEVVKTDEPIKKDGRLTEKGKARIRNAVLQAILSGVSDANVMKMLVNDQQRLDTGLVVGAAVKSAPGIYSLKQNQAKEKFDISADLANALAAYVRWRDANERKRQEFERAGKIATRFAFRDWVGKKGDSSEIPWSEFKQLLKGDLLTPLDGGAEQIADLFAAAEAMRRFKGDDTEINAGRVQAIDLISDYFDRYVRMAQSEATEDEGGSLFGDSLPALSKLDLMSTARTTDSGTPRFSAFASLFDDNWEIHVTPENADQVTDAILAYLPFDERDKYFKIKFAQEYRNEWSKEARYATSDELDKMKSTFEQVDSVGNSSYIMPDGTMIKLSKDQEHDLAIQDIIFRPMTSKGKILTRRDGSLIPDGRKSISAALNSGCIRVASKEGGLQLEAGRELSDEQIERVYEYIDYVNNSKNIDRIYIDYAVDGVSDVATPSVEYVKGTSATTIMRDLEDYRKYGLKPGKTVSAYGPEYDRFFTPEYWRDGSFSVRKSDAPRKTKKGYKVFVRKSDGKLYPPMVANPNGQDTPVGVWLDADEGKSGGVSKTGRRKVKAGGKGTNGGGGTLSYRPGWHLGTIPYALQFNVGEKVDNPLGIKNKKGYVIKVGRYFPSNFVWAEVEYADDVDYQEEAESYGKTSNGGYNPALAGLPRIPENGSYVYRTNPNPATDPWIITGAMKVNRVLSSEEVDEIVKKAGRSPQERMPDTSAGAVKLPDGSFSVAIGEKGAGRLGDRKSGMYQAMMQLAAKYDRRAVWERTGWYKGVDQKWRMRIANGKVSKEFERAKTVGEMLTGAEDLFKAYPELENMPVRDRRLEMGTLGSVEGRTIYVDFKKLKDGKGSAKAMYMEDLKIELEKYNEISKDPFIGQMADIKQEIEDQVDSTSKAIDNLQKQIDHEYGDRVLEVVVHEIQHHIQEEEGFAKGSNVDFEKEIAIRRSRELGELFDEVMLQLQTAGRIKNEQKRIEAADKLNAKLLEIRSRLSEVEDMIAKNDFFPAYFKSSGEVEARYAGVTRNDNPNERGGTAPWEWMNSGEKGSVREEDQVVRFSVSSASSMRPVSGDEWEAAKREFGVTDNAFEAGYILPDGTMLDFSEKNNGGPGGMRTLDHRAIGWVVERENRPGENSAGMDAAIASGAIRLFPEVPGCEISVEPSTEAMWALRDAFDQLANGGSSMADTFVVEFRTPELLADANRYQLSYRSANYSFKTSSARIASDIRSFFQDGTIPEGTADSGLFSVSSGNYKGVRELKQRDYNNDQVNVVRRRRNDKIVRDMFTNGVEGCRARTDFLGIRSDGVATETLLFLSTLSDRMELLDRARRFFANESPMTDKVISRIRELQEKFGYRIILKPAAMLHRKITTWNSQIDDGNHEIVNQVDAFTRAFIEHLAKKTGAIPDWTVRSGWHASDAKLPHERMPFLETGIKPDHVMNEASFIVGGVVFNELPLYHMANMCDNVVGIAAYATYGDNQLRLMPRDIDISNGEFVLTGQQGYDIHNVLAKLSPGAARKSFAGYSSFVDEMALYPPTILKRINSWEDAWKLCRNPESRQFLRYCEAAANNRNRPRTDEELDLDAWDEFRAARESSPVASRTGKTVEVGRNINGDGNVITGGDLDLLRGFKDTDGNKMGSVTYTDAKTIIGRIRSQKENPHISDSQFEEYVVDELRQFKERHPDEIRHVGWLQAYVAAKFIGSGKYRNSARIAARNIAKKMDQAGGILDKIAKSTAGKGPVVFVFTRHKNGTNIIPQESARYFSEEYARKTGRASRIAWFDETSNSHLYGKSRAERFRTALKFETIHLFNQDDQIILVDDVVANGTTFAALLNHIVDKVGVDPVGAISLSGDYQMIDISKGRLFASDSVLQTIEELAKLPAARIRGILGYEISRLTDAEARGLCNVLRSKGPRGLESARVDGRGESSGTLDGDWKSRRGGIVQGLEVRPQPSADLLSERDPVTGNYSAEAVRFIDELLKTPGTKAARERGSGVDIGEIADRKGIDLEAYRSSGGKFSVNPSDLIDEKQYQDHQSRNRRAKAESDETRTPVGLDEPKHSAESAPQSVPGRFSAAYPSLSRMSDDELLAAAIASRIALGNRGHAARAIKLATVMDQLKNLHPTYTTHQLGVEATRVVGEAQRLARAIRKDLEDGVAESRVMSSLPERLKEMYREELREQAIKGREMGAYGMKAARAVMDASQKVAEEAVAIQSGIETTILENTYGVDLADSLMKLASNPMQAKPRQTTEGKTEANTSRSEGVAGEGADIGADGQENLVDVSKAVSEAVGEIAAKAGAMSERDRRNRENAKNAAGRDAELENEAGTVGSNAADDSSSGSVEDPVTAAVRRARVDLNDPRHLAYFVEGLARRYWNDNHRLRSDTDPWSNPVAYQFLRRTAQNVYSRLIQDMTYSQGRESAFSRVQALDTVPTPRGLISEMEYIGGLVNRNRIWETQKSLCERLDLFLRTDLGATGRFSPDKEELRRKVSAELELQARYTRHAIWLTPAAAAEEARELTEELNRTMMDFEDNDHDPEQSKAVVEITRKLGILREFGSLRYKPVAQIEAALQHWKDQAEGAQDEIIQKNLDRDERTMRAAAILADAMSNKDRKYSAATENKTTFSDYIVGHMGFYNVLMDLTRFSEGEVADAAHQIIDYIAREIQKAGDRASAEKRNQDSTFYAAVERIYNRSFRSVMADMTKVDERFAPFMGRSEDGKPIEPTRGRAMQLLVSLLQEGHVIGRDENGDEIWSPGYHDNIVRHKRENQAAQIKALLLPEDLNMITWLGKWYDVNRQELSDVATSLFGIGVYAETFNYWPVRMQRESQGLEKGTSVGWTIFPKALTPRVRNELDFDTTYDIFSLWRARMEEGAQWKAHAKLGLELRGIFGRANLQNVMVANHGKKSRDLVLGFITDILSGHGTHDRSTQGVEYFVDKMRGWAALSALGGNVGVMLKQPTSLPAFGFEIGLVDTGRHIATAFTPSGIAAMRAIFNSEQRKTRWQVGNSEVVANALNDSDAGVLKKIMQATMITNKLGDIVPGLVVGQGLYREFLSQGMSDEDAMAQTWEIIERTQQSSRIENQASFQRRNKFGRALYQFLSTQQQYLQYEARAIRDVAANPRIPERWRKLATTLILNHFILSSAYFWMGELYKSMLGQDPPEDQLQSWVVTCLLGPYGALYAMGFCCTATLNMLVKGQSSLRSEALSYLSWFEKMLIDDPMRIINDVFSEDKTFDDILEDLGRYGSDFSATFRDLRKVYKNYIQEQ